MSTRVHFVSLSSIDPIRDAIASNDDDLVEAAVSREEASLREDYDDDEEFDEDELDDFREYAESMIMCDSPPDEEPGCWNYVIGRLAEHLALAPEMLSLQDWKFYDTWEPYVSFVAAHVTPQSRRSLEHLKNGRPLKGSQIDHDGCAFSWLSADEVKELHQSLSKLDKSLIRDTDLQQFHDELVDCLKSTSKRNAALFMAAH